ncbi:MAG: Hsp20/alpha crystallin family protein [Gammaproteobacteria bacterium]|nr:Hsp20/alpha crystallin family protein [Gammaproteobacteria bacterium]
MANETKQVAAKGQEIQKAAPMHIMSPFEEMERMFESMLPHGWMRPLRWAQPLWSDLTGGLAPRVDVIDRDDEIVVRAEVPGVDKKDLDVSMTENSVTIKGSVRREAKEEKGEYCRCEIAHGAFTRTIALPAEVDDTKAKAVFKDGMLELTIPKREKAKRHSVAIQ